MKFARENNFLEPLARWPRHGWALLRIDHELTEIVKKCWQTNFKQIRWTHPRDSKMGKSAHVRTSVEPHLNLTLLSLFCGFVHAVKRIIRTFIVHGSGVGSKIGSKFKFIPLRIWNVACSCDWWKIPRPCSSTLGQVERFSGTDPLSLFHSFHGIWRPPCSCSTCSTYSGDPLLPVPLDPLVPTWPTCAIWLYHLNLCQLSFLRFFFGFLNVIPFLEKLFGLKFFFKIP